MLGRTFLRVTIESTLPESCHDAEHHDEGSMAESSTMETTMSQSPTRENTMLGRPFAESVTIENTLPENS